MAFSNGVKHLAVLGMALFAALCAWPASVASWPQEQSQGKAPCLLLVSLQSQTLPLPRTVVLDIVCFSMPMGSWEKRQQACMQLQIGLGGLVTSLQLSGEFLTPHRVGWTCSHPSLGLQGPGWPNGGVALIGCVAAVEGRHSLRVASEWAEQFTSDHRREVIAKLGIKEGSPVSFQSHKGKAPAPIFGGGTRIVVVMMKTYLSPKSKPRIQKHQQQIFMSNCVHYLKGGNPIILCEVCAWSD